MKITYEEFKRVNNTTKTRFNHTVWSGSIVQIIGVQFSKGLCQIKHMDQEKIYEETIQNIVSMILKGYICVNNPSALKEWKGFVNESNISNVEISVNNRIFNDTLEMGQPSMVLLNLRDILSEEELEDMIDVNCRYFDIDNNELIFE